MGEGGDWSCQGLFTPVSLGYPLHCISFQKTLLSNIKIERHPQLKSYGLFRLGDRGVWNTTECASGRAFAVMRTSPQASARKSPSRRADPSLKWPVDPSYTRTEDWAPATPRQSPFREEDPVHFWKPFGTNKVGFEELDAAVLSDRYVLLRLQKANANPACIYSLKRAHMHK